MSTFEIDLDKIQGDRLDVELSPSKAELDSLFEAFEDDFQVADEDDFQVDLSLILDGQTVLLTGEVSGTFAYRCGRCLTDRTFDLHSRFDFKLLPESEWKSIYSGEEEISLEEEDLTTDYYEGHSVDVSSFVRDAVSLELPQWPQCPDELRDECDAAYEEHVGEETMDKLEEHSVDLRWWPLKDIELENDGEGTEEVEAEEE